MEFLHSRYDTPVMSGHSAGGLTGQSMSTHAVNGALPSALSPLYFESVHRDFQGEWDFGTDWKPRRRFPMYAGWVRAIRQAQLELQAGLQIDVPALVMHSLEVELGKALDDVLLSTDS